MAGDEVTLAAEDEDIKTDKEGADTQIKKPRSWLSRAISCIRWRRRPQLSPFESELKNSRLLKRVRRDFLKFDSDGSGTISVQELSAVIGIDRRSFWARAILDYFDSDADGRISYEEFVSTLGILGAQTAETGKLLRDTSKKKSRDNVIFIFAILDFDGNNVVDRSEFSQVLWEYERRKQREFGKMKRVDVQKTAGGDDSFEASLQEKVIAQHRADRREFLRPVRMRVKSAILYLSRQCKSELTLNEFVKVYDEFPELFEVPNRLYKKVIKKIVPRCVKLVRKLHPGVFEFESLQKKVIESAIMKRLERERMRGKWDWALNLQQKNSKSIDIDHIDDDTLAEIAQIDRLLRGERIGTNGSAEEREFLSAFSFRRDGSFRRMESRRLRGPRASGVGRNSQETSKMRARQLSREPPDQAATVLSELGVTAQKEVIRLLTANIAAKIIAEMGQLERDILLSHFKGLVELVKMEQKEKERRLRSIET
jgi:serine/threonine-protein phosphatase 2B regulatory subunit